LIIFILSYLFVLPTSFLRIPKTHNRTSLQVWHANILHFCYFCNTTFSGATRKWDALYIKREPFSAKNFCSVLPNHKRKHYFEYDNEIPPSVRYRDIFDLPSDSPFLENKQPHHWDEDLYRSTTFVYQRTYCTYNVLQIFLSCPLISLR
jgi:hypothetical protein